MVKIWDLEVSSINDAPNFLQPDWPDGTPWANKEEASSWAEIFIESLKNPYSEFIPGLSPSSHPTPRPRVLEEPIAVVNPELEEN